VAQFSKKTGGSKNNFSQGKIGSIAFKICMLVFVLFCSENCQSRVYSILDACKPQSVDKLQLTAVGGTLECTWNKSSYKKIIPKIAFVKFEIQSPIVIMSHQLIRN
jgi:hypothetical protein